MTQPRKLLIVTYHFPPSAASGSYRLLGFARHLPRFGWRPVVVAPPEMPWEPVDPGLLAQVPAEAAVYPVPFPRRLSRLLIHVAPKAVWLPRAWLGCRRAIRDHRPDAVLTSGPPHAVHALGLLLRRHHGLPWVADFRDPWVGGGSCALRGWRRRWTAGWERRVMEGADVIVANAPRACAALQAAYPGQQAKMVTLTNGFDPERFESGAPAGAGADAFGIVHAGELYAGRDPRPFLDAVAGLAADGQGAAPPLRVRFLGRYQDTGLDLPGEVARRGLGPVATVAGQVPYGEAVQEMLRAKVLLLLDSPGRRAGVPAKLYEYLGTGRSILALAEPDSDTAWVLRQSGVHHRLAPPLDAAGIWAALEALYRELISGEAPAPDPQRLAPFTREGLARQLAHILDDCQVSRPARPSRPGQTVPPSGGLPCASP
jgi:hypothetical protein